MVGGASGRVSGLTASGDLSGSMRLEGLDDNRGPGGQCGAAATKVEPGRRRRSDQGQPRGSYRPVGLRWIT